jgi:hypothetical protein
LCCLSFFDMQILITTLVSSNSSYAILTQINGHITNTDYYGPELTIQIDRF